MARPQKGKNRKRPRAWHRGPKAGRAQIADVARLEKAERRGARLDAEVAEVASRGREETELWQALAHVAPFVPSWL